MISLYQVGELFGNVFNRAATAQNAIGFEALEFNHIIRPYFQKTYSKRQRLLTDIVPDERTKTLQKILSNEKRFTEISESAQPN